MVPTVLPSVLNAARILSPMLRSWPSSSGLEQQPFKLNQAQALSFRGREAEPGTHEHRRLRTVARPLRRRVYGSRALLRSPGMTEPGWVILNGFCSSLEFLRCSSERVGASCESG